MILNTKLSRSLLADSSFLNKILSVAKMTYSNSKNLMRPLRTCEDGTSPGWTLADKKTTGLLKIQERVLPPSTLVPRSGCKIGCSRYFSY